MGLWKQCPVSHSNRSRTIPRHDLNNEVFSLFSADGPPVVGHYDISDTDSNHESMNVEAVRPTVIKHELKTHRGQDMAAHSGCIRALSSTSGQLQTRYNKFQSSQWRQDILKAWVVISKLKCAVWQEAVLLISARHFWSTLYPTHRQLAFDVTKSLDLFCSRRTWI